MVMFSYRPVKKRTAFVLAVISIIFLFFSSVVKAEKHVPYDYKFKPSTYEKKTTPRKGRAVFTKDPNVWVYTSAFAKRFGMPEKWIDDSLEGAEAVAYRVQYSNTFSCGYFGDVNNCRQDSECVFDVYLRDEDSAKLPWNSHKSADWQNWDSSRRFLSAQKKEDLWYWNDEVNNKNYIRTGATGLRSIVYVGGPPSKKHRGRVYSSQGGMRVQEYRRDFYKGLNLIELNSCSAVGAIQPVRFYFLDPQPNIYEAKYRLSNGSIDREKLNAAKKVHNDNFDNGTPPHKVKLPDAYMDRVNKHDKQIRYPKSLEKEVLKRLK